MSGGPASVNIKVILLIIALLIAGGTLYYTQNLVEKLQQKQKEIVELYAKGIEYVANSTSPNVDITFLFDNIIKPIDFPLILTDAENRVYDRTNIRNIKIDSTLSDSELQKFLSEKIDELDKIHPPILVNYEETILNKIHYGDSEYINQLRYYPYIQIIIAALFIVKVNHCMGFSNSVENLLGFFDL